MATREPMTPSELVVFIQDMTSEERRAFKKLTDALKQPSEELGWYLTFGQSVLTICGEAQNPRQHGRLTKLADVLGRSPGNLSKIRDFASDYSKQEVQELVDQEINWSLIVPTLAIPDKSVRLRWVLRARSVGWNGHLLEKKIQEANKGRRRKGGRPRRRPESHGYAVDLAELVRMTEHWLLHSREVWTAQGSDLRKLLAAVPPRDWTRDLLEEMKKAEQLLKELAQVASAIRKPLLSCIEQMQHAVNTRKRG